MTSGPEHDGVERWSRVQSWIYAAVSPNPRSNRVVVALADPGPGDVVVDIGCGAGAAVRAAAHTGASAIGVDPSASMVENARRRSRSVPNTDFREGHAASLPFEDGSVSHVLAIATFHHWPDGHAGLAEIRRVLRPTGRLLVAERRLRGSDGHGLTDEQAAGLAESMRTHGFEHVGVEHRRLRIITMSIVSGRV